jgi:acyl-CoA synthetase (AMP-forming)/AMP-acid ligase II
VITSSPERIATLTAAGEWGTDTLHGLLERHAVERGSSPAVRDQPNRTTLSGDQPLALSWSDLNAASRNLAAQLRRLGLGQDDRVLVQLPNVCELLVLYYALSRLGAVASPVPVQYGRHELGQAAAALQPAALITLERGGEQTLAADAAAALPAMPCWVFGRELALRVSGSDDDELPPQTDANRVTTICWTSGTTGTPKGVPRSHNLWFASARATIAAGACTASDVLLNPFPMVNMASLGGAVYPAALLGCSLVLHHPLDAQLLLGQLQDQRVSFAVVPPALLNQLARAPQLWRQFDFSALRRLGSGSAPLSPQMIRTFRDDYGVEVINIYGSNEGIALYATPETVPEPERRADCFPRPADSAAMATRVVDPDSGTVLDQPGGRGELLVRGATVFDGYYRTDNTGVFSEDGYFHTGDLVEITGDGPQCYRIVGRCKDIINRGGVKISPAELDLALEQHPDVAEAAVCAYPDARLGERVCACLVLQPGAEAPTPESLQPMLLEQGFARFKLPERVEILQQLPRNALGKVQRFALQEALRAHRDVSEESAEERGE